jgi:hypothetical protein
MVFTVVIGITLSNLKFKQIKGSEALAENVHAIQARTAANSQILHALQRIIIDSSVALDDTIAVNNAVIRTTTTKLTPSDTTSTISEYEIISIATVIDPNGLVFEAKTQVVYEFIQQSMGDPTMIPEDEPDFFNNPNRDLWVSFHGDGLVYWKSGNNSSHNMSQNPPAMAAAQKVRKEDVAKTANTIMVPEFEPAQVRLNSFTPFTFDLNIIFPGAVRIDGPLIVEPGVRLNIFAERIIWGNWHASTPRPYIIDAHIYTPLPPINQPTAQQIYNSIALRKDTGKEIRAPLAPNFNNTSDVVWRNGGLNYPTSFEDFLGIINPIFDDDEGGSGGSIGSGGSGGSGGGIATLPPMVVVKMWKEFPIETIRP